MILKLSSYVRDTCIIAQQIALTLSLLDRQCTPVFLVILLCLTSDDFICQGRASGWERVNWAYCICPSLFHNSFPTPSTLLGWKPKNLPRHCRQSGSPKLHADMQSLINIIYVASFCRQCCVMSQNFVLSVYQPFQTSQNHPFCYFTLSNVR